MMKSYQKFFTVIAVGALAISVTPGNSGSARAGSGAAFLGGMLTSHIVGGAIRRSERRTQAEEYQAYRQQPQQPQYSAPPPQAAAPAQKSVEQRIKELEGLANKGLISKQEYQTRRKAILDGI